MFFINLTDGTGQPVTVNVSHIVAFGSDDNPDWKTMLMLSNGKLMFVKQTQIQIMAQINQATGKVAHV